MNETLHPKYKIFEKNIFNSKTFINISNSLKISLSQCWKKEYHRNFLKSPDTHQKKPRIWICVHRWICIWVHKNLSKPIIDDLSIVCKNNLYKHHSTGDNKLFLETINNFYFRRTFLHSKSIDWFLYEGNTDI